MPKGAVYGNVSTEEAVEAAGEVPHRLLRRGGSARKRRDCLFLFTGMMITLVLVLIFLKPHVDISFERGFGSSEPDPGNEHSHVGGHRPAATTGATGGKQPATPTTASGKQPAAPARTGAPGGKQPAAPATARAPGGKQPAAPATTRAPGGKQPAAPATTLAPGASRPANPATTGVPGGNRPASKTGAPGGNKLDTPRDEAPGYHYDAKEVSCDDEVIRKFGSWKFYDDYPGTRPEPDYSKYPNRDVKEFPSEAWQADAVYVNHFLDEALKLVRRGKDAIYAAYGLLDPKTEDEKKRRKQIFRIGIETYDWTQDHAGFTTRRSFDGLVRRLLHAVMTRDTFSITVVGHSAAVGHGNNFQQNYAMQCHEVLEPVFSHLGVKLMSRMIGQGGLGTLQTFLAGMDLLGPETDLLYWDSSMTEKDWGQIEFGFRQALMSGKRAPALFMTGHFRKGPFHPVLQNRTGATWYLMTGNNVQDLPVTVDEQQALTLPYNARYVNCAPQAQQACRTHKYTGVCWADRPGFNASAGDIPALALEVQKRWWPPSMGGRASWHPGDRMHRLTGYTLAFQVLVALENALLKWSQVTITNGHPLMADHWHVTKHYTDIRQRALAFEGGSCATSFNSSMGTPRICNTPMHGKSEFTPRADPDRTSIRNIMKAPKGGFQNPLQRPYDSGTGFDFIWTPPSMWTPKGQIHVPTILRAAKCPSGGSRRLHKFKGNKTGIGGWRRWQGADLSSGNDRGYAASAGVRRLRHNRSLAVNAIQPGIGWELHHPQGFCDGSYEMRCRGEPWKTCPLYGHADGRGGWKGGCLSGWLVVNIKDVTNGLIILKIEFWHGCFILKSLPITSGWTAENNGSLPRRLRKGPPGCDQPWLDKNLFFDYAVNGKVTTLNGNELKTRVFQVQRVVQLVTVLDDPNQRRKTNYEVAIRMRGCGLNGPKFALTHVYWS